MNADMQKMEDDFQIYFQSINMNLNYLEMVLKDRFGPSYQLDFTPDSLDDIEMFLSEQLDNYTIEIFSREKLLENISTYMGEIIKRKLNGRWNLSRDPEINHFGHPVVENLDGIRKKFGWWVMSTVSAFETNRKPGHLKSSITSLIEISESGVIYDD
jgi:hypothetical protein